VRLVAPGGTRWRRSEQPAARIEQVTQAVADAPAGRRHDDRRGALSVGAERAVAPVANGDGLVERDRGQPIEPADDDRLQPPPRPPAAWAGRRGAPPAGSGTTRSTPPSASWSAAVIFIASAAVEAWSAVRHRIAAQPSGLMTE